MQELLKKILRKDTKKFGKIIFAFLNFYDIIFSTKA